MADDREPQDWFGSTASSRGGDGQPSQGWQSPPNVPVQQARSGSGRRRWTGVGLVAAGLAAGGVLAGTLGASAATGSSTTPTATYSTGGSSSAAGTETDPAGDHGHAGPGHGLNLSGTVTAVGTASVTIKTATATTTYAVNSSSDIDKNGEATLSKLAVGDAVTFSTTTSGSVVSIDKLHAGNEALDRPQERPMSG